ncbi:hypothetical protein EU537_10540 [Candidatus Thorarchaeota archaeon]|nr:MAG: hypothetical protein EU537_10540 [Candidatus Thorarchaeota archaeon]
MQRLVNRLDKMATSRNLAITIITSMIVISIMSIGTQSLVYDVYGEADMPDLMFRYDIDDVSEAFGILGSEGLDVWLTVHLLDYIFPAAYSLALAIGIITGINKLDLENQSAKLMSLIPIFAGVFDCFENIIIAQQALAYPNLSASIISMGSFFTSIKWLFLYLSFVLVFFILIWGVWRRVSRNNEKPPDEV